jgi:hypothetical protein
MEVQLYAFFSSTLDGGEWSVSRAGRFTRGKGPRYLLHRRLGSPIVGLDATFLVINFKSELHAWNHVGLWKASTLFSEENIFQEAMQFERFLQSSLKISYMLRYLNLQSLSICYFDWVYSCPIDLKTVYIIFYEYCRICFIFQNTGYVNVSSISIFSGYGLDDQGFFSPPPDSEML